MKKVLSLVLVLALVLGSFSFAFAFDDVADLDCEDAVDTLVALGVINGYNDGTFRPEDTVTRAQIAKMLVVALGYEDLISGTTSSFTDCAGHWADPYIAFAAGQGIVNGYPNGTFKPNATVSYDEAITMIVRALGYTDDCLAGTWPTNYKIKALDLKVTDDVKLSTGGADRGGVAMLIYNALEAEIVTVNADDEVVKATNADDIVTMLDRLGEKTTIAVIPDLVDPDHDDYQLSDINLKDYMYEDLEVYVVENEDGDDVVVYLSDRTLKKSDNNNTFGTDVISGTIDEMVGNKITIEDADEDTYTFDATNVNIFFNGAVANGTVLADVLTAADTHDLAVDIKAVFETDANADLKEAANDDILGAEAIVVSYATKVVQIEDEYDDDDLKIDGIDLPVVEDEDNDDEEIVDLDNLTVTGDATSLEDIKEDDIVVVYASDKDGDYPQVVKLAVSRATLEGKVTKKYDGNTFQVAGEKVDTTDYDLITNIETAIELSQDGIFYLDNNGEIVVFDGTTELENYAVIVGVEKGDFTTDFDQVSIDDLAQIKLATAEGEEIVYDVYSEYDADETVPFETFNVVDKVNDNERVATEKKTENGKEVITLDADLVAGTLVKYDLNSDGQIDDLEIVKVETENAIKVSGSDLGNSYRFTADTILFDAKDGDYKVVELADVKEDVAFNNVYVVKEEDSTFGNIEVIILPSGAVDSSDNGIYAMINDADDTLDADDDSVQELSLLIDGKEVTYLTDDDNVIKTTVTKKAEWTFNLFDLTIDDELVTGGVKVAAKAANGVDEIIIYGVDPHEAGAVTVQAIESSDQVVRFGDTNYSLEDDVVVYVANYDTDDWDDIEVGDVNDIDEEDYIKAYNLDADDDDDAGLDVIIVFTGDVKDYIALP